jgi:hypothetical protein
VSEGSLKYDQCSVVSFQKVEMYVNNKHFATMLLDEHRQANFVEEGGRLTNELSQAKMLALKQLLNKRTRRNHVGFKLQPHGIRSGVGWGGWWVGCF